MRSPAYFLILLGPALFLGGCKFEFPDAEKLPTHFLYSRAEGPGVSIPVKDWPDRNGPFKAIYEAAITETLNKLPLEHIRLIRNIVVTPFSLGKTRVDGRETTVIGSYTPASSTIYLSTTWNSTAAHINEVISHEVGHAVQMNWLTSREKEEWKKLHALSTSRNAFTSNYAQKVDNDLGGGEDFAESYYTWTLKTSQFTSNAMNAAQAGNSALLQKYLFIAALFAHPENQAIDMFEGGPVSRSFYQLGNSLFLGLHRFDLEGDRITRVTNEFGTILLDHVSIPLPAILLDRLRWLPTNTKIPPIVYVPDQAPAILGENASSVIISPNLPTHYTPILSPEGSLAVTAEQEMVQDPDHVLTPADPIRPHGNFTVITPPVPR